MQTQHRQPAACAIPNSWRAPDVPDQMIGMISGVASHARPCTMKDNIRTFETNFLTGRNAVAKILSYQSYAI